MTVEPLAIVPTITSVGVAALLRAQGDGVHGALSHMAVGRGIPNGSGAWKGYKPTRAMTGLLREDARVPLFSGTRIEDGFRILARFPEALGTAALPIWEVSFILSTGEPLAIWSEVADSPLTFRTPRAGVDLAFELILKQLPVEDIDITVLNPDIPDTTGILARMLAIHAQAFTADIRRDWPLT